MKKFLFAVMAASALVACENQDVAEVQPPVGEKAVTLSIQQTGPKTRGVTDQKGTDEYAVIGSGIIFFIDNSGNNVYKRELTVAEIDALDNTTTTPGGNEIMITGVPNTATTLFFVANAMTTAHTSYPTIEGTTAADARLRIDKLQTDPIHVPMSGQSTPFVSAGGNLYTTSVTITPLVARVEVGQITCKNQNDPAPAISADITGYKLAGVFVNNVRPYVLLAGTPYLTGAPIDIKAQVGWTNGWSSYFNATNEVFPYFNGGSPSAPSDWVLNSMVTYCSPTGAAALSFYPDVNNGATSTDPNLPTKQAWAFQVCPSNTVVTRSQAYDLPHLILKLTDVTYVANPFGATTKYVTITNYKTANDVAVTKFERGNVYRIINLTFTHNETTNQPYEENITVTATVSVAPWVINEIVPDWN